MEVIKNLYLCYGKEEYKKNKYVEKIKDKIIDPSNELMNLEVYDGKNITTDKIIDSAETMPFMSERRLIIVKNSGFFKRGKKEEATKLGEYIEGLPSTVCIVFMEKEVDRRLVIYKKVNKNYTAIEFKPLSDRDLMSLVQKELKNYKVTMKNSTASYFISVIPEGVESLFNELKKLANYKENGQLSKKDIDNVCTRSLDIRIFELVKMLGNKDTKGAISIYQNLLEMKESPIGILAMISRQFRMILKVKYLKQKGNNNQAIVSKTGFRFFMVNDCVKQSVNFRFNQLEAAIRECLFIDEGIKTGKVQSELGVELLIIKYSSL